MSEFELNRSALFNHDTTCLKINAKQRFLMPRVKPFKVVTEMQSGSVSDIKPGFTDSFLLLEQNECVTVAVN
jgi:hypothetical protein